MLVGHARCCSCIHTDMQDERKRQGLFFFFITLFFITNSSVMHKVYAPSTRARLETAAHFCEEVVLKLEETHLHLQHGSPSRVRVRVAGRALHHCLPWGPTEYPDPPSYPARTATTKELSISRTHGARGRTVFAI